MFLKKYCIKAMIIIVLYEYNLYIKLQHILQEKYGFQPSDESNGHG